MSRLAAFAAAAMALVLTMATVALANRIRHEGTVEGIDGSRVAFAVGKRDGELKNVRNLRFEGLPVSCSDGSRDLIELSLPKIPVEGRRFSARLPVRGDGISDGKGRSKGRFRRGGKRASGEVAVSYTLTTGLSCRTGELAWRSRK